MQAIATGHAPAYGALRAALPDDVQAALAGHHGRRTPAHIVEAVCVMYGNGEASIAEIAHDVGLSETKVRQILGSSVLPIDRVTAAAVRERWERSQPLGRLEVAAIVRDHAARLPFALLTRTRRGPIGITDGADTLGSGSR